MDDIEKFIERIPLKHKAQIIKTIDCLKDSNCRTKVRIEKLSGSTLYKARSGKYRIGFEVNHHNEAIVRFVRLRNEKTYRDV